MNKKCYELYEKAKRNPVGIKFGELQKLCLCIEMQHVRTSGSHHIYRRKNPHYTISIQEMGDGMAKPYQVRQLIDFIDDNDLNKLAE